MSPAGKGKANPFFGKKHTEEARRKMSEAATGRVLSEEHKRKIGEASKRRAMTEASRKKLAEYNRTKVVSAETRRKISRAVKRQWESPEGREKFLDSRKKAIQRIKRRLAGVPVKRKKKLEPATINFLARELPSLASLALALVAAYLII